MPRPDAPTQILEFTPAMRILIEDAIEALILLLDEIDGDAEAEPELGSSSPVNQAIWGDSPTDDREEVWDQEFDPAERGIADAEGVHEQYGTHPGLGCISYVE